MLFSETFLYEKTAVSMLHEGVTLGTKSVFVELHSAEKHQGGLLYSQSALFILK